MIFDELVRVFSVTAGVSQAGAVTEERNIRVSEKKKGEELQSFTMDVYDRKDPLFIYRGTFSRQQFDEIRKAQRLKYNFENAPSEIVTSIRDTRRTSDEIIQLVMEENKCRLELVHRTKHSDFVTLFLELTKLSGVALNDHLIGIIQAQKQKVDAYSNAVERCAQLSEELARLRKESEEKTAELQEENTLLENEMQKKDDELERNAQVVNQLQADLRNTQAAYDREVDRIEQLESDNVQLVRQLDDTDLRVQELEDENQRFKEKIANLQQQVNYAGTVAEQYTQKYSNLKRTCERLQEALSARSKELAAAEEQRKREVEELTRKCDSLKTHEELLKAQLKDLEEKLAAKENMARMKNDQINKRIFKSNVNLLGS